MTPEERRAYSRGFNAGRDGRWPAHRPPVPPNEIVKKLLVAAFDLRNALDGELAMLDEDDPWQTTLGNHIDSVDEALKAISIWLDEENKCP